MFCCWSAHAKKSFSLFSLLPGVSLFATWLTKTWLFLLSSKYLTQYDSGERWQWLGLCVMEWDLLLSFFPLFAWIFLRKSNGLGWNPETSSSKSWCSLAAFQFADKKDMRLVVAAYRWICAPRSEDGLMNDVLLLSVSSTTAADAATCWWLTGFLIYYSTRFFV